MQKQLKKYLSFFFLFLLLFPIAEKGVHAFEHHDEVHCTITDKHFHELEQECSICDFTLIDANGLPNSEVKFIPSTHSFSFQEYIQRVSIPYAFSNLPSRAPPSA